MVRDNHDMGALEIQTHSTASHRKEQYTQIARLVDKLLRASSVTQSHLTMIFKDKQLLPEDRLQHLLDTLQKFAAMGRNDDLLPPKNVVTVH